MQLALHNSYCVLDRQILQKDCHTKSKYVIAVVEIFNLNKCLLSQSQIGNTKKILITVAHKPYNFLQCVSMIFSYINFCLFPSHEGTFYGFWL
jgi:hypothetical protein